MNFNQALTKKILIAMGPFGSNLHRRGLMKLGENTSTWCFRHKEEFQQSLQEWVDIGCDILFPNTSEANPLILEKTGESGKSEEICTQLIDYTREMANNRCLVAGDMQPVTLSIGQFLMPYGNLEPKQVYESYQAQAGYLHKAGVDFFWVFTMTCLEEVELAVRAIKDSSPLPVIVTMAFDRTRSRGYRTLMGVEPVKAAQFMNKLEVQGFGVNCGKLNLMETTEILGLIGKDFKGVLAAKPNAGIPEVIQGETIYPVTPEEMARHALKWKEAGIKIISGCCGTTPAHIRSTQKGIRP